MEIGVAIMSGWVHRNLPGLPKCGKKLLLGVKTTAKGSGDLFIGLAHALTKRGGDTDEDVGSWEWAVIHEILQGFPINPPNLGKLDRGNGGAGFGGVEHVDLSDGLTGIEATE